MTIRVTVNGRVVRHPLARFAVTFVALTVGVALVAVVSILAGVFLIVTAPLWALIVACTPPEDT